MHLYEQTLVALVPVYNIEANITAPFQLGNASLYPNGSSASLLLRLREEGIRHAANNLPDNVCFLKINVAGDGNHSTEQALIKAERALMILRFVARWIERNDGVRKTRSNRAVAVQTVKPDSQHVFFLDPDDEASRGTSSHFPSLFSLDDEDVRIAREYYGLDDLNYHCANLDNPVSARILQTIELYDSGVKTKSIWQALYRYVVCVNMIIQTSDSGGEKIRDRLTTLLEYGGIYVGSMAKENMDVDPDRLTWKQLVDNTVKPYTDHYIIRSQLLHGNEIKDDFTDEKVQSARQLAHNAIRIMAQLAHEFEWSKPKEVKKWFEAPRYSPRIRQYLLDNGLLKE